METEIGAVTLSRFYALHTIWLPWLAFGLVGVHLFFVRYYGSSGTPQNTPKEMKTGKPFYPDQVFEDVVGMFILFVVLGSRCVVRVPSHLKMSPIRRMRITIRDLNGISYSCFNS